MNGKRAIPDGPDFICIGMSSSGTGWLFDQLKDHPDFWIPPVKEFSYLRRDIYRLHGGLTSKLELFRLHFDERSEVWSARRPRDHRDTKFLEEASRLAGLPRDIDRYSALFNSKGTAISGEITPGYALLDTEVILDVAAALPDVKILLMLRDPLERAWSILCKRHRDGVIDGAAMQDAEKIPSFYDGGSAKICFRQRLFAGGGIMHRG